MIIIGIDPGTLITGYGVIESVPQKLRMLKNGIIRNTSSVPQAERLAHIFETLCEVITQTRPDHFAIETAFFHKNVQSALKIGQARGVALLAGATFHLPIEEYSPREIKKAVVGNGAASKKQVQFMMMQLFRINTKPKFFDQSDALAVAVCHAFKVSRSSTKYRDWQEFIAANPDRVLPAVKRTLS